jgi:hypothetical protein
MYLWIEYVHCLAFLDQLIWLIKKILYTPLFDIWFIVPTDIILFQLLVYNSNDGLRPWR